ncbi:MAG TPA: protease pro-enzyme activation domain-containing protein [Bryobacteraceae bacterium]|nr:protease pro-enzyme activation domain-containing protein [Bryobacteraceae bacterium]
MVALLAASSIALISQNTGRRSVALIHDPVDENNVVTLVGNTRPEANSDNDLGAVSEALPMDHMMLQLKRSAAQEQAAAQFVEDLYNPNSANFHKWVTAEEWGKNFGAAESDIKAVTNWLESHGFTVNSVYPNGLLIDFSGNAGQVRRAFRTAIHHLNVEGVRHVANLGDPQIPAALATAVEGVVSLHDFRPRKMVRPKYEFNAGGQTYQALAPADLAAIYDFNPLFSKGITGAGQTIVVIEDTDVYTASDWSAFRSAFGLAQYSAGSITTQHPRPVTGTNNCRTPGANLADDEAILDAEWASAAAPGAAIVVGACADTATTFGGFIAMQNIINATAPPAIISISYGECEASNGYTSNVAISKLYQQAAGEGISVFVSAGDEGAAGCDASSNAVSAATHGIGVNAFASTIYNVAVGGTDFADVLDGTTSKYWSSSNSTTYGSALSYIPEIPWNGSCASSLVAQHYGYSTGYGQNGFCVSLTAQLQGWVQVSAGGGGPSGCGSGFPDPTTNGIVNGTCAGTPKPSWQTGLAGIPNDGVRDLPDVSMFASNGVWGHYYIVCFSDPNNGGAPCTGAPSNWAGFGGTSVAAPILAGIQAMVNQSVGAAQGNPNPVYYALAASTPSAFHSISRGDITVNCAGTQNCYGPAGFAGPGRGGRPSETSSGGALSVSSTTFTPAYAASDPTWNFATGIGSVDANNLVTNWPKH